MNIDIAILMMVGSYTFIFLLAFTFIFLLDRFDSLRKLLLAKWVWMALVTLWLYVYVVTLVALFMSAP